MGLLSSASWISCSISSFDEELQQADGLLQLRGHGQRLADLELEGLFHASIILERTFGAHSIGTAPA